MYTSPGGQRPSSAALHEVARDTKDAVRDTKDALRDTNAARPALSSKRACTMSVKNQACIKFLIFFLFSGEENQVEENKLCMDDKSAPKKVS